jgi:hypothetical protein
MARFLSLVVPFALSGLRLAAATWWLAWDTLFPPVPPDGRPSGYLDRWRMAAQDPIGPHRLYATPTPRRRRRCCPLWLAGIILAVLSLGFGVYYLCFFG